MIKLFVKTQGIIRLASILKALNDIHHFQCNEDTVKTIIGFVHASDLSNDEIVQEVLEAHSFEQLKVEMGIDEKEAE